MRSQVRRSCAGCWLCCLLVGAVVTLLPVRMRCFAPIESSSKTVAYRKLL